MNVSEFTSITNRQARTQQDIEKLVELAGWKNDPRITGFIRLAALSGDWGPLSRLLTMRLKDIENTHPFIDMPRAED
ncbi:MAG: hypothetical protein M1378_11665, partial [Bacteroidetes bacterium]|nr:hypothetical protein [Bacteroidota bacterium]